VTKLNIATTIMRSLAFRIYEDKLVEG